MDIEVKDDILDVDGNNQLVIDSMGQNVNQNANSDSNDTGNQCIDLSISDVFINNNEESNQEKLIKNNPESEDSLDEGEIVDDDDMDNQPNKMVCLDYIFV